jgi:virginiamycin B lyase
VITNFSNRRTRDPEGITAGPDGNLWIADFPRNTITRLTTAGRATAFTKNEEIDGPSDIAVGPDGALWFAELGDQVGRITTDGDVTTFPVPLSDVPAQLVAGPDGNIWYTGIFDVLGRLSTSGHLTTFTAPTLRGTRGIAVGPDGAIWFTNQTGDSIGRMPIPE